MRDAELGAAQHRVRRVKGGRGALVGRALTHGLDRRAITRTLSLAYAAVSRRNGSGAE